MKLSIPATLRDSAGEPFTVDAAISYLLSRKHITQNEDGTLMVRIYHQQSSRWQTVPLAKFIYEALAREPLASHERVETINRVPRDLRHENLIVRSSKKQKRSA